MDVNNTAFALGWLDFSLKYKGSNYILNRLNGFCEFAKTTALMGPSGSGKSTFLESLAGKHSQFLSKNTKIFISKKESIRPRIIKQDVSLHLYSELTAYESIKFAFCLKNIKNSMTGNERQIIIDSVIYDLSLKDCLNTKVSNLSGGEQKRLVIAMELSSKIKPNLLLIDEPTSGLDSFSAVQTIRCLANVAKSHEMAIISSIHQPSNEIVSIFDMFYVLAKCGQCVYFGPSSKLREHLNGTDIEIAIDQSPIETLLKAATANEITLSESPVKVITMEGIPAKVVNLIQKVYKNNSWIAELCSHNGCEENRPLISNGQNLNLNAVNFILKRSFIYSLYRPWKSILFQIIFILSICLFLIILFGNDVGSNQDCSKMAHNSTDLAETILLPQKNLKFIFFYIIFIIFMQLNITVLVMNMEIEIFLSEHFNNWYSTSSYFLAKLLVDLPVMNLIAINYCLIGFYGSDQPNSNQSFIKFTVVMILGILNTQGFACFMGNLCVENSKNSLISAIAIYLVMVLFSSFFIDIKNGNLFIRSLSDFSFVKLVFHSLLIIIYGQTECELKYFIFSEFGLKDNDLTKNIIFLIITMFAWRLMALNVLMIKANKK